MTTTATMVDRVRHNLYGAFPTDSPFVTTLSAAYTDAEGVIDVLDENDWDVGDTVENTETGELMKVLSVTTDSSNVLTVVHGWMGTDTAASAGTDDVLFKNPRFTQAKIEVAVQYTMDGLEDWGIHGFGHGTIVRADPKKFYELDDGDIFRPYGVLKVYEVLDNSELPRALPFKFEHNLGVGPSEYSSEGEGVHILDWGQTADTGTVHYIYAQRYTNIANLTAMQEEIVEMGATASVLGGAIAPATQDPGARTDRTVQPGQISRDVRFFQGIYYQKVRSESAHVAAERQGLLRESARMTRSRRWRA